jgi:S-adenosylmethionine synthetase
MKKLVVESVLPAHPDKVCDQIADAVLDECLKQDPATRAAIEVFGTNGVIMVGGELTTDAYVDVRKIALQVYNECGYKDNIGVLVNINEQSKEISKLADKGAGDSGIVHGYACDETPEMMPWIILEAHKRAKDYFEGFGGDGKVMLIYDKEKGEVKEVSKIQHRDFEVGGFAADSGLTGRKVQVDTYDGLWNHGGGSFSGKDATKVDRSGAYMARWLAKRIIKKYKFAVVMTELAYEIGKAQPVHISVCGYDDKMRFVKFADSEFKDIDLSPAGIIKRFRLDKPKGWSYKQTACYGHFGRLEFPWEKV